MPLSARQFRTSAHRLIANYLLSEQFQIPPARPRAALGALALQPRASLALPRAGLFSRRLQHRAGKLLTLHVK